MSNVLWNRYSLGSVYARFDVSRDSCLVDAGTREYPHTLPFFMADNTLLFEP